MVSGLCNLGNTCSINSLLQCLSHSAPVVQFCNATDHQGRLTNELSKLIHVMVSGNALHNPRQFLTALYQGLPMLIHGEQHDICEVWMFLCEAVGKECFAASHFVDYNYPKEVLTLWKNTNIAYARMLIESSISLTKHNKETASKWTDMFQGLTITQVRCPRCTNIYHNFEPFVMLALDAQGYDDICSSIYGYLRTEYMSEWTCDKCNHRNNVEKDVRFWTLPPVLVISLKRFSYNPTTNAIVKHRNQMRIPKRFTIDAPFIVGPEQTDVTYELRGIAMHYGEMAGGHYVAIGKSENGFHVIDDASIQHIGDPQFNLADAYLMVFDRVA